MATPSVRAIGTAYNTAANAAATASFSGGTMPTHAINDLLVQFVTVDAGTSTTSAITAPSGWTELTDLAWGTTGNGSLLYGRAYALKATSASHTFTAPSVTGLTTGTSGGGAGIRVVSFQNVDIGSFPGTPGSVIAGSGTALTPSATTSTTGIGAIGGFTPTVPYNLVVVWGGHAATSAANTNVLSGDSLTWTEQFDDNYSGGGDHMAVVDTAPQSGSATAVTAKTFTFAAGHTAARFGGKMAALKGVTPVATLQQRAFRGRLIVSGKALNDAFV